MRDILGGTKGLITVLVAITMGIAAFLVAPTAASASTASDEEAFVRDINGLRASRGLGPMQRHSGLDGVARTWATQMAASGKLSHNPNLAKQAPAGWKKLGENVGVGGTESALFAAFVNSPGHFANLVDSQFNQIGVSVVSAGGRIWTVHVFMAGPPSAAAPAGGYNESEAARYLREMSSRVPAANRANSLLGLKATGRR